MLNTIIRAVIRDISASQEELLYEALRIFQEKHNVVLYDDEHEDRLKSILVEIKNNKDEYLSCNKSKDKYTTLLNKIEEFLQKNIVKLTCKELGITQKELAERLDVSPASISDWANGNIPKMAELALNQILEIKELKEKLEKVKEFKTLLDSF